MNRTGAIRQVLASIGGRLRNRPDSEHEQAIVRVVIVTALLAYFYGVAKWDAPPPTDAAVGLVWTAIVYLALSSLYVVLIMASPGRSMGRRVMAVVTDCAAMLAVLKLGGEHTAPLYPIYLWITLGFGFRFGLVYLAIATAASTLSFAIVLATTGWWLENLPLGIGLLVALVAIPA